MEIAAVPGGTSQKSEKGRRSLLSTPVSLSQYQLFIIVFPPLLESMNRKRHELIDKVRMRENGGHLSDTKGSMFQHSHKTHTGTYKKRTKMKIERLVSIYTPSLSPLPWPGLASPRCLLSFLSSSVSYKRETIQETSQFMARPFIEPPPMSLCV